MAKIGFDKKKKTCDCVKYQNGNPYDCPAFTSTH